MKWLLAFLLAFPSFAFSELTPVMSKGRIRPLSVVAKEWLLDTYGAESFQARHRGELPQHNLNAEDLMWWLTLQGKSAWDNFPLFAVDKSLTAEWKLPVSTTHVSFLALSALPELPGNDSYLRLMEKVSDYQRFGRWKRRASASLAESAHGIYALPSKHERSVWLPLNAATLMKKNQTAYPDATFEKISRLILTLRESFDRTELAVLKQTLKDSYLENLAGVESQELALPSLWQLKSEVVYYKFPWTAVTLIAYCLAALLIFAGSRSAWAFLIAAFALHTTLLGLRCLILLRPPVSNMVETIIYVPWVTMAIGFLLYRIYRHKGLLLSSTLSAVVLLSLVTYSTRNPDLETVQPVLNSHYWLTIHVLMVVGSYGAFILSGVVSHLYLIKRLKSPPTQENKWILNTLYTGTILLISGTILGGVWAAQSWGRFWDWDPKESWAFISSCLYLAVIHAYRFGRINDVGLAIGSIVGLQAITFTWYGVNYILGVGLHSYGFGQGGELFYAFFVFFELFFVIIMAFLLQKRGKMEQKAL